MKKLLLSIATVALCASSAFALPKAFYVKQGDKVTKYNFGVAENLVFSNNGHTLSVKGYGESINLDEIDYISFSAPLTDALTPSAQKERLVTIGTEAYNTFDINDQADILNMWHDFFDSDWDDNYYDYAYKAPVKYEVPLEYYNIHGEFDDVVDAAKAIVKGDPSAIRVMKAAVVNLYKMEDYFGIYTADKSTSSWVKSAADYFEIRFGGRKVAQYSVKLTAGKEYTTWTSRDFDGRFPREIDITIAKGDKVLATAHLSTVLVDRTSIDMTLDFDAAGYKVNNVLKVVDDVITDNVKVNIKDREYVTADSKVYGRNFVKYEEVFDAIKAANGYYDENDNWVDEDGSDLCAMFAKAHSTVDLLGKLQVRGVAYNASKIYSVLNENDMPYDTYVKDGVMYYVSGKISSQSGSTIHKSYNEPKIIGRKVNVLNDHTDAGFYYDGNDKIQGYLGWDYTDVNDEMFYSYPENPTFAYTIVDGYLVGIEREEIWDPVKQNYYYGAWHYNGTRISDESTVVVPVNDNDVLYVETVIDHELHVIPILWFPDGTSFSFEDFFDENSFTKLIDDYNDIINTYLTITDQEQDSDDK